MAKPVRAFSCFWGDKHVKEIFPEVLVRSLCWPLNKAALQGSTWEIWTKEKDFAVVADIAKDVGMDIVLNDATPFIDKLHTHYLSDSGVMMNQMWKLFIKKCLDLGARGLTLPPDTIFGGESIPNILMAGEQPDSVVFVLHMRVLPHITGALDKLRNRFGPLASVSNAKLVTLALQNAHRSWVEAEAGGDRINSFVGGIHWKTRASGLVAAQHHLMTPYLINFTKVDYDFFNRETKPPEWPVVYGTIDHTYPATCVFPLTRARVLGSSDDAFMAEVTEPESNVPPLDGYSKNEPDKFWRNELHNLIFKQFVVSIRGE